MITLVTGNKDKQKEIEAILEMPLTIQSIDLKEIQSMSLEEVVRAKAAEAYAQLQRPLIVEDVSFEIEALNGFPGPLVKWWEKVVGYDALIEFIAGKSSACRALAMAAYTDGNQTTIATGEFKGQLVKRAGDDGFGFDFYMVPEGYDKTVAQLGRAVKNKISHRAECFRRLKKLLKI